MNSSFGNMKKDTRKKEEEEENAYRSTINAHIHTFKAQQNNIKCLENLILKRRRSNRSSSRHSVAQREQKQHPAKRNRNNNNNYGCNYNSCVYVTLKPRMLYELYGKHTTIVTFTLCRMPSRSRSMVYQFQ